MSSPGDEAFRALVEAHRRELRLHCYRMLGSSHDADDVVQEAFVRAWRARGSVTDPSAVRAWLYRIATNVCLDELRHRKNRPLPSDLAGPGDPSVACAPPGADAAWLEPYPDPWLGEGGPDLASGVEMRESIALAFVAALQGLSARQRAVLLLRDVLGMSAEEAAASLGTTASGIDSTLYRARAAVKERARSPEGADGARYASEVDEALLARYVRAWDAKDVSSFVALLHDDVVLNMPPTPTWLRGRDAVGTFYATHVFAETLPRTFLRTGANGQPAVGVYVGGALTAIHVVRIASGHVTDMHHFMTTECLGLFGLPLRRDG
jgi:RNA polymerase sigma-70 factor (ECF subfamily)